MDTFTIQEAARIAVALQAGETDGWSYTIVPIGRVRAKIEVLDETGEFVGYWVK